jgi:hypothetical protein
MGLCSNGGKVMNRKIAFRIYDKKRGYGMVYFDERSFCSEYNHISFGCDWERYGVGFGDMDFSTENIMEFTGLTDKNDKDIYEGDIVVNGVDRYIVEYRNGGFNLAGIDDFTHDIYIWFEHKRVEVVGNIFENRDMLAL